MSKNYLPVGSVVLLKGGIKKLVIMGINQVNNEDASDIYDYISVLYPEGYLGNETLFLFNHEDINDVIFRGYENPEREDFLNELKMLTANEEI